MASTRLTRSPGPSEAEPVALFCAFFLVRLERWRPLRDSPAKQRSKPEKQSQAGAKRALDS